MTMVEYMQNGEISLKMEDLKILQERSCSKIQVLRQGLTLWIMDESQGSKIMKTGHILCCKIFASPRCFQWRRRRKRRCGRHLSFQRGQRRSFRSCPSKKFWCHPPLHRRQTVVVYFPYCLDQQAKSCKIILYSLDRILQHVFKFFSKQTMTQ